ncbi:MAG: thioredoxin domain-containing protein [Bacteroidota bacterium]
MTANKFNHLRSEHSPYLLQHARNPVDWYPWGTLSLDKARDENRLMIISIGYAACHWCHVMEHESFEDDEVARVMNGSFVSVKVDREERPDVDQVYMNAAYVTTGRGGWPLNVIALPDQRPLFAGTYFSKHDWLHVLNYFTGLYRDNPRELIHQADEVEQGMKRASGPRYHVDSLPVATAVMKEIFLTWRDDLDFINGGTPGGPKFPMPANLACLLRFGFSIKQEKVVDYVNLTLEKMAMGGIYDHLGGGFSRYSVDASWHVPHFEKMLYDNAQLVALYADAFAVTKKFGYKQVVEETIAFTFLELTGTEGLFYASLDADSEGREGTFYTWRAEEITRYLGDGAGIFLDYYSCRDQGNWEHGLNVLRKSLNDEDFAGKHDLTCDQLSAIIDVGRKQLFTVRGNRERPATDDKILTCWNGLMISALVKASLVFVKPAWLEKAVAAASFYRDHVILRKGKLWRNTRAGSLTISGFLDDYGCLGRAFLDLYQATFDASWLTAAELLIGEVMAHFEAGDGLFFNLSSDEEPRLILQTIELSDNVIPASNSVMATNLWILGYLTGNPNYIERSEKMVQKMVPEIRKNPAFHANWALLLQDHLSGPVEVCIIGEHYRSLLQEFSGHYLPGTVFAGGAVKTPAGSSDSRHVAGKTLIYVCRDKSCFPPVETVDEALRLIAGPGL